MCAGSCAVISFRKNVISTEDDLWPLFSHLLTVKLCHEVQLFFFSPNQTVQEHNEGKGILATAEVFFTENSKADE